MFAASCSCVNNCRAAWYTMERMGGHRVWGALGVMAAACSISSAGCATTTPSIASPGGKGLVRNPNPTCRTRTVVLAPQTRAPGAAAISASESGYALAWHERAGQRQSVRFLLVDRQGLVRSPSVEVVDADVALQAPAVSLDGDGYLVAWRQGDARYARRLDGKGRPRADVQSAPAGTEPAVTSSRCTVGSSGVRCTTNDGHALDLPANETVVTETVEGTGLALASSGAEGLKLWLLDCGAQRH